jgi:nicotinate phosphoribosyltransferase
VRKTLPPTSKGFPVISALFTDLYQLTMAYGYWQLNMHDHEAVFHLVFRNHPFKGNYTVACGLDSVIDLLQNWRFTDEDVNYLQSLRAANGSPLFSSAFLAYLLTLRFSCDIDAVPEGTIVFPQQPLIRVKGPLIEAQILESVLLNIINFQTLIATKASRICHVAKGGEVLEFGLRRAQGPDGALSASRAAYIGGCTATSNVLAGKQFGIPVRGTHAHSWVAAFSTELEALTQYAAVMPNNCVLLVDTFNTVKGVKKAIKVGKILESKGFELMGVRLDSGDLYDLSVKARKLLDEAGFKKAKIVASNSLDEYSIKTLLEQGAKIDSWGVGTNLVTAYDSPALEGVYKLSAIRAPGQTWAYKVKLSEQAIKISNPGINQVRRYFHGSQYVMDVLFDTELGIDAAPALSSLKSSEQLAQMPLFDSYSDLLLPIFKAGKLVFSRENIASVRERALSGARQFLNQMGYAPYPTFLELNLSKLKNKLIEEVISE